MLILLDTSKTLSYSSPNFKTQIPNQKLCKPQISTIVHCKSNIETERGLQFDTRDTFFRHESATGRDLAVLAAALYKQEKGNLRVVDAMCGCGIRSLRYLVEAQADFVVANDANESNRRLISQNLSQVERGGEEGRRRWAVTHFEANRLLTEFYLQRDFFDFIDIDSFGSDASLFFRSAFSSLKMDGLIYVTSTDGYSSGGHRPYHSLAALGAYIRPMPYANEIGLRALIGGAVREACVLGYHVTPLFSYYSYHGPVFRVLLRLNRGQLHENRDYGFICYCPECVNSWAVSWDKLGQIGRCCSEKKGAASLVVSGPLWTGPLHSPSYIMEMLNLAKQWGWVGNGSAGGNRLEQLLMRMADEGDPRLPFGFIKVDEIARRAKANPPPIKDIVAALQKEGYVASRSHISSKVIKTNSPMAECIRILQRNSHTDANDKAS